MRSLKRPFLSRSHHLQSALIALFLIAACLRFAAVDYALPYIVNPDEPNFYRLAQDQRGVLDAGWRAEWLAGYPPGYPLVYTVVVEAMHWLHAFDIHQDMSSVVGVMRLVNVLIDLLTMACVIRLASSLGGAKAGLLAASVYTVSTPFVQNAALALPDPLLTLLVTTCALCGLWAWQRESVRWGLLSTLFGLLAVIVKYPAGPVLLLPALFFLRDLMRRRARALPGAALALVMVIGVAYVLWVIYGAGSLNNMESNQVRSAFVPNTLSVTRWYNVFKAIGGTLGIGLCLGVVAILGRTILQHVKGGLSVRLITPELILIGVSGLAVLALVPGYLANIPPALYPVRYTLPAAGILMACAAALMMRLIQRWPPRVQVVMGLVCLCTLLPDLSAYALPLRLDHPLTAAQAWFETNVPDGSVIWMESVEPFTALSRYDKGYRGIKSFAGLYTQDNMSTTPELRESVDYLLLNTEDEERWPLSEGWDGLDHYTRIKAFNGPRFVTPHVSVYLPYTLPNSQTTHFTLGAVQLSLRGVQITEYEETLSVTSYWQSSHITPSRDYSYSLYLTPTNDPTQVIGQRDAGLGRRPTSTWSDPMEIVIAEHDALSLPVSTGESLSLWLVIYDSQTGERLMLDDSTAALHLQTWTPRL